MSYKDYGIKPLSEKSCKPYAHIDESHCNNNTNEYDFNNDMFDKEGIESSKNCLYTAVTSMKQHTVESGCQSGCKPSCKPSSGCKSSCGHTNHNPKYCPDDCIPQDKCCSPEPCNIDPCKTQCVCTYMDVLYSEGIAKGSTSFNSVTLSAPNFTITPEFISTDPCCPPCSVGPSSIFTVDSVNTTIKKFLLPLSSTIATTNISVNGEEVLAVFPTSNGYTAIVDSEVLNDDCVCHGKGSKGNVLAQNLTGFEYVARYVLCGKVSTNGSTCNFKLIVDNNKPSTLPGTLTFIDPEICLPPANTDALKVNLNFVANGQLVNPVITAVGGPAPAPVTLTINGNLMLNAEAQVQVLQNSKVCFTGTVN